MKTLILEIHNPEIKAEAKFKKALDILSKATKFKVNVEHEDHDESSPYKSVQQLDEQIKDIIEHGLMDIFLELSRKWLGIGKIKKASVDYETFRLNGRIFINPKTGNALTVGEWKAIQKDLNGALTKLYGKTEEMLSLRALALGKVLQNMNPEKSINTPLADISILDGMKDVTRDEVYDDTITMAKIHTGQLIQDITQTTRNNIVSTIMGGYKDNISARELRTRLFDQFSTINRDFRRIAETEIATNFNNGYLLAESQTRKEDEPVFMKGISGENACPFCKENVNGKIVVLVDEPTSSGYVTVDGEEYPAIWPGKSNYGKKRSQWQVSAGSQHPSCVLPGQEVVGSKISSAMKSFYKGIVIEMVTRDGHRISVTENHPILTSKGFKLAKFFKAGDDIITSFNPEKVFVRIDPNNYQAPTMIENIFSSAKHFLCMGSISVPSSSKDFHGDGEFIEGNIDIVDMQGFLRGSFYSSLRKHINEILFKFSRIPSLFISFGSFKQMFQRKFSSSNRVMGFTSKFLSFLRSCFSHTTIHSFRSSSWNDISFDKSLSEGHSSHSQFSCQFLFRFARQILFNNGLGKKFRKPLLSLDTVIEVNRRLYTGHVYDLTANDYELYAVNGVIVKNCRCTWVRYYPQIKKFETKLRDNY